MDNDKCDEIFDAQADGGEELDIEKFGLATFEALKNMKIGEEEAE